ncbi:MAG: ROK family protein [Gaiellaceae bacterium]
MGAPLVIGVDVGGTKILSGVVDRDGNVLRRNLVESPGTSEQDVLGALDACVEALLDDRVGAIGLGVPANLDRATGRVLRATNLPLDDFDLAAHARSRFGLPVAVENDANAAALAEWKLGAGKGLASLVMLTLGTGVGGGVVLDGRLFRGWAEIGHMVVQVGGPPCQGNCHGRGHLEALASGSAADRVAQELWGQQADSRTLVERARAGVDEALGALDEVVEALGAAIGSLANLFDPELVIVGGGFGEAVADLVLGPAQEAARRQALAPADGTLRVVPASLGEDAGLVGAGLVGFEALDGAW